ncbi:MAG: tRNA dihydrouridine synthase DusB [Chloroflexota bacterium]|jgi:tRNA-dihydrouridine synthase B
MINNTTTQTIEYPLRIGNISLETPLLLAPMTGFTDLPFRITIRRLGGVGLAYTEMVNPQTVLQERSKRRRDMLATSPEDRPLGYQIYGKSPQQMAETARCLEGYGAVLIDINMGCPMREIVSGGGGAALLKDPPLALSVAEAVVRAVSVPVTVKLRLGWDDESRVAADLARGLERVGIAAITVHGRTRAQGYEGEVSLDGIREVVEAVDGIPVIGNGDVNSPEEALRMLRETGCRGIMVGRGATKNPWLVRDLDRALRGLPSLPRPTLAERWELLRAQFERTVAHYGEQNAAVLFRKWFPVRAEQLELSREALLRLLKISDLDEMRRALTHHETF